MIGVRMSIPCEHNEDRHGTQEHLIVGVSKKGKLTLEHIDFNAEGTLTIKVANKDAYKFRDELKRIVLDKDDRMAELNMKNYYIGIERADCFNNNIHVILVLEKDNNVESVHMSERNAKAFYNAVDKIVSTGSLETK
ncbi:hypothetical protein [Bacillus thuringiensis]|uniref:hypothetical protein n=1 Tax=Bacillus thuringiensis TaxID=1428 RepID=UPI000A387023|nr:hypothetical protein [Bacillus thuringiensis]OTZ47964.1 hypothetical protein BK762_19975 [Bacillus thuringiensis serovar toumanoffi]